MARTLLTTACDEGGAYFIRVAFQDEDGSAVTPNSAAYTVTDKDGNVVGVLSSVELTSLATSVDIVLSGGDTTISASAASGQVRIINIEYTYDSNLASGLTSYKEAWFTINDLVAVS